jgi:hypothetical protein
VEDATIEYQGPFDYSEFDPATARRLRELGNQFQDCVAHSGEWAVRAGLVLIVAKPLVGHSHWLRWIASQGMSADVAEKWMRVAKVFESHPQLAKFTVNALWLLSAQSTPERVRTEALALAEQGF